MEKIQKNSSTGFFGSEPSPLVLISHTDMISFFLAEQQAGLGGDRQNHGGPFRRLEGSRHYRSGPLS